MRARATRQACPRCAPATNFAPGAPQHRAAQTDQVVAPEHARTRLTHNAHNARQAYTNKIILASHLLLCSVFGIASMPPSHAGSNIQIAFELKLSAPVYAGPSLSLCASRHLALDLTGDGRL
jgi:hypothetical protein